MGSEPPHDPADERQVRREVELNGDDADHPGDDVKRNADLDEIEVAVAAD